MIGGLGTGGALDYFRKEILASSSDLPLEYFYVMHADICCNFPLKEVAMCHLHERSIPPIGTLLTTQVIFVPSLRPSRS